MGVRSRLAHVRNTKVASERKTNDKPDKKEMIQNQVRSRRLRTSCVGGGGCAGGREGGREEGRSEGEGARTPRESAGWGRAGGVGQKPRDFHQREET